MIAGRPAATIALHHRRQVQPVDHLDDKPREMLLGKPFIERRRKQKPRRAVKLPEIAHQARPASESIPPIYLVRQSSAKSDRLLDALAAKDPVRWGLGGTAVDFVSREHQVAALVQLSALKTIRREAAR